VQLQSIAETFGRSSSSYTSVQITNNVSNRSSNVSFDEYRQALLEKAEDLRRSMSAQNAAEIVSRLDEPSDAGDLSVQSYEEWLFINRNSLEVALLREVQDALHRIDLNTYAVCQECHEPISTKRLQVVPWAKFCVRCQEMLAALSAHNYTEVDR
jgi:DnaK suppressor protein